MRSKQAYDLIFTKKNLEDLFISSVKLKPSVGIDYVTVKKFQEIIDSEIDLIIRKCDAGEYKFTNYRQKLIPKGKDKKPREICIPTVRDKLTLKALSCVLDKMYGDECFTPQPQSIIAGIHGEIVSGKFDSFAKLDIKEFYSRIPHDKLLKKIGAKARNKQVRSLIQRAISTPSVADGLRNSNRREQGIPEGLSISGKLANVYLSGIDDAYSQLDHLRYYRYVDDILILCQAEDVDLIKEDIASRLRKLKLTLNSEKTKSGLVMNERFNYLGYEFRGEEIGIRRSSIISIESKLQKFFSSYRTVKNKESWLWRLNLLITGCLVTDDREHYQRYGWMFYFSQSTDASLPRHFDALMQKYAERYDVRIDGIKSFRRTYNFIKHRSGFSWSQSSAYGDNFDPYIRVIDTTVSTDVKRDVLKILYPDLRDWSVASDEEIDRLYRYKMMQEVKTLERDVGSFS